MISRERLLEEGEQNDKLTAWLHIVIRNCEAIAIIGDWDAQPIDVRNNFRLAMSRRLERDAWRVIDTSGIGNAEKHKARQKLISKFVCKHDRLMQRRRQFKQIFLQVRPLEALSLCLLIPCLRLDRLLS